MSYSRDSKDMYSRKEWMKSKAVKNLADIMQYQPLDDHHINELRYRAILNNQENNHKDTYMVEKVDRQTIQDVLFVRSTLPFLYSIAEMIKNSSYKIGNNYKNTQRFQTVLHQICAFLFDIVPNEEADLEDYGELVPVKSRQRLLMDFGIIDILFEMVHFPIVNKLIEIDPMNPSQLLRANEANTVLMREMIIGCYDIIKYGTSENPACELYASQWLKLLINYSLGPWASQGMGLRQALRVLMHNNIIIVEKRVDTKIIKQYVAHIIDHGYDERFLELLRVICICNDTSVKKNQTAITQALLASSETREKLIFSLNANGEFIMVKNPFEPDNEDSFWCLEDFKGKCLQFDSDRNGGKSKCEGERSEEGIKTYKYFYNMLYLLGDICRDRNKEAIEILRSCYDFETSVAIIQSDKYPKEIRAAIVYLVEHLYINVSPFRIINYPTLVKFWSKIEENISPLSFMDPNKLKLFEPLKKFVYSYLNETSNR
jgi:hypothetical protein